MGQISVEKSPNTGSDLSGNQQSPTCAIAGCAVAIVAAMRLVATAKLLVFIRLILLVGDNCHYVLIWRVSNLRALIYINPAILLSGAMLQKVAGAGRPGCSPRTPNPARPPCGGLPGVAIHITRRTLT